MVSFPSLALHVPLGRLARLDLSTVRVNLGIIALLGMPMIQYPVQHVPQDGLQQQDLIIVAMVPSFMCKYQPSPLMELMK